MFCSRSPSLVVLAQTVLEIFDREVLGNSPIFLRISLFDFPNKNLNNVWEGVSDETYKYERYLSSRFWEKSTFIFCLRGSTVEILAYKIKSNGGNLYCLVPFSTINGVVTLIGILLHTRGVRSREGADDGKRAD